MHSHANYSNLGGGELANRNLTVYQHLPALNAHVIAPKSSQENDRTYSISSSMTRYAKNYFQKS